MFFWSPCSVCVYVFLFVTPPGQTKNDTDLKFATHPPLDHIWERLFCFFIKVTLRAGSLEKLPCHMDFSHISSIALFRFFLFILYCCLLPFKSNPCEARSRCGVPVLHHTFIFVCITPPDLTKSWRDLNFSLFYEKMAMFVCSYTCPWFYLCHPPPDQTKNYRDLKFGTHIPLDNT